MVDARSVNENPKCFERDQRASEVKAYDKNPPRIAEKGLNDLIKSIELFGLAEPILIAGLVCCDLQAPAKTSTTTTSANPVENLRPPVFFDSLLVTGVSADDYVTLAESDRLI
jgi:hypothetical protein